MKSRFARTAILVATFATLAAPAVAGETWQQKQNRIAAEENLDQTATGSIPGSNCDPAGADASLVCRVTDGNPGVKFPSAPFMITSGF